MTAAPHVQRAPSRSRSSERHLGGYDSNRPVIVGAEGSFVWDERGRRYVDFVMGWCVGNLGWNVPDIVEAARTFDGPQYVAPSLAYQPWLDLAAALAEVAPGKLHTSFRATGGTEAVEIALQAAMAHTGRHKFLTIEGCYHGNSIAARGITSGDTPRRRHPTAAQLPAEFDDAALARIEKLLERGDVAAFVMEPVIHNLGVRVPPDDFLPAVQDMCHGHGTLLVMDEVATGFGRTGALFASQLFDIEPDILCLAKAITNGVAPMGATLMTEEVAQSFAEEDFYSTYGWHPVSVAAALATLAYFRRHHDRLFDNVAGASAFFRRRLESMRYRRNADVRIQGLAIGVDFDDQEYAEQLEERCRNEGLLVAAEDTAVSFFPALTIDRRTAAEGLDIFESCL